MKPATTVCWLISWLAASCFAAPVHLTQAQLLAVEGHGFSPPPYSIDAAGPPGEWTAVELPHVMPRQLLPEGHDARNPATVVTWYRVQLPASAPAPPGPAHLYIPRWKTDGQIAVYADGRLVYRSQGNLLWNGSNHPLWIALDDAPGARLPGTVVLRIERLRVYGGAISSLWLGDEADIGWRYRLRELLQIQLPLMTSAAFLAVGVFALFVWLRQRQARLYLLFFVMAVASYIRNLHYYVGQQRLPISDEWFGWLTVNSLFWLVATAHFFMAQLHGQPRRWLDRAVVGVTIAVSLATLPLLPGGWLDATVLAPLIYALLLLTGITAFSLALASSWRAGSRDGILVAGWSLFGMGLGIYDWLQQSNKVGIEGSYLGSLAGIGAFLFFMYVMYSRYTGALDDVHRVNAGLEERLRAREAELFDSYSRLREAERRQVLSSERQRLTQDIHDGLGSSLVSALRVVEGGRMDGAGMAEVLKSCIDDLKLAIDSMEPVDADLLLLLATLRFRLESRLDGTGIALHWDISDVPPLPWLDPRSALHILRILQEAFANILKHSHATEIRVSTAASSGWVTVSIADNGHGFVVEEALRKGGKGLANQRRRARAMGAEVLHGSSSSGSILMLRLPMERGADWHNSSV